MDYPERELVLPEVRIPIRFCGFLFLVRQNRNWWVSRRMSTLVGFAVELAL